MERVGAYSLALATLSEAVTRRIYCVAFVAGFQLTVNPLSVGAAAFTPEGVLGAGGMYLSVVVLLTPEKLLSPALLIARIFT